MEWDEIVLIVFNLQPDNHSELKINQQISPHQFTRFVKALRFVEETEYVQNDWKF